MIKIKYIFGFLSKLIWILIVILTTPFVFILDIIVSFTNFTSNKTNLIKAIKNNDIKSFKRLLELKYFDINFEIDNYKDIVDMIISYDKRDEMLKLILNSNKLKIKGENLYQYLEQSLKYNYHSDVNQLLIDKIKSSNYDSSCLLNLLYRFKKIELIFNNVDYFINRREDLVFIFRYIVFGINYLNLLDDLYNKGVSLPILNSNEEQFKFERMCMKMISSLENFENFDDFFQVNKFTLLRKCDDETMNYLLSKY